MAEDPNNPFWFPQFAGYYEPIIAPGTTLQYWRGDKTWQTLDTSVVPENTNLYFTNARAIASTLTGYVSGAGTITSADTILQAIQKLNGNMSAGYVPYSGASSNVDLGTYTLTTPTVTGGSAVGSQLTLQGTSANGTSTVQAIKFLVGNNGATNGGYILNGGQWNIGNAADNLSTTLGLVRIGQGTAYLDFGQSSSGVAAIWANAATPTTANYIMQCDGTNIYFNTPSSAGQWSVGFGNATNLVIATNGAFSLTPSVKTSGAVTNFTFTGSANTGQTASTEINRFLLTTSSRQWATGAITTQREVYITSPTYSFVGASTITNAYTLYVEAPTAGTNATITNKYALGVSGGAAFIDGTTIRIGQGSGQNGISFTGALSLSDFALWGTGTNTVVNTPQTLTFRVGNTAQATINSTTFNFSSTGTVSTGASTGFTFTASSNTGQTASTEIPGFSYASYSRQWAAGAITTQREQYIKTVTYAFASASTITNAYGLYIEAPTAGSNATITNNFALGLAGNLQLQTTTSSTTGVIFKGATRFLHNYNPTGSSGRNLFLGDGAGNFTATWSSGSQSTANTGLGYIALQSLTTGSYNNCIGAQSGQLITNGNYNNLQGYYTGGELVSGGANVAIGESSLRFGDGSYNVGIGYRALFGTTANSYSNNVAIGAATGYNLTTGSNNIFIGYSATTGGITSGSQNILIGYSIAPQSVTANGQLSIGNLIFGQGISATGTTVSTGTVGIGIVAATTAILSLAAGTTAKSQINFASSTAPSSPVNGDLWFDGTDWKVRAGGTTYTLTKV